MNLDFVIIGAQKSATTALFKYLEPHHEIAMPKEKEAPLFTREVLKTEVDEFMSTHYAGLETKLKGKATPQYMCDRAIPMRLKQHNPDLKLIAVLRDPIERAWSQYRMNLRRGTEHRTFTNAVTDLLEPESLAFARAGSAPMHKERYESEGEYYLAWSEYGRILESYLRQFRKEQLLIVYTHELEHEPRKALDKVLQFLNLPTEFTPACLGDVIHKGGSEVLISNDVKQTIRDFAPVRYVWDRIPETKKNIVRYWFEQMNVKKSDEAPELDQALFEELSMHFAKDAEKLVALFGTRPPWIPLQHA